MKRYLVNISFKSKGLRSDVDNVVETVKTKKEAMSFMELVDDTVDKALVKDQVTGKIEWIRR